MSLLRLQCWPPGATVPRGGGDGSSTPASVRSMDSGLRPGPAPAGGAASRGCVVGLPSRGLEDCSVSESGLFKLLH